MVGFTCHVMGKCDPTEFFYGMTLMFDGPPHLAELKRTIETQIVDDNCVCEGSEFVVSDIEILDLRLNQWVNLDSRSQLYSGCHLAAVRDIINSTAAGQVDAAPKSVDKHILGFALDAQQMYNALDAEGEGSIRMKSLLKALRHDPNYAIEVFSFLDDTAAGTVTFQDFLQKFNDGKNRQKFEELKTRIAHGGKGLDESVTTVRRSEAFRAGSPGGNVLSSSSAASHRDATDDTSLPEDAISLKSKASLFNIRAYRQQQQQGEMAQHKMQAEVAESVESKPKTPRPAADESDVDKSIQEDPKKLQAAKGVVELLQRSISKKKEKTESGGKPSLSPNMMTKLKSLRGAGSPKGPASPAGAAGGLKKK